MGIEIAAEENRSPVGHAGKNRSPLQKIGVRSRRHISTHDRQNAKRRANRKAKRLKDVTGRNRKIHPSDDKLVPDQNQDTTPTTLAPVASKS